VLTRRLPPVFGMAVATCVLTGAAGFPWNDALAGAPFITDDAGITKRWEIDLFSSGTKTRNDFSVNLPAVEIDYGMYDRIQFHAVLPLVFDSPAGGPRQYGYGDTELGIKVRVFNPAEGSPLPRIAVFPLVEVPTGNADRGLGTGHLRAFLPVWLDKELAEGWTAFGGGGFWLNQLPASRNYWYAGAGVLHDLTEDLHAGIEVFHQTGGPANKPTTGFNIGAIYDVTETVHVLGSAGQGIRNVSVTNQFSYYVGLQFTF